MYVITYEKMGPAGYYVNLIYSLSIGCLQILSVNISYL